MAIYEGTEFNRFQPATGKDRPKWTDELIEELKRLRKQGKSFTELALHFGGFTRNAIAGKCHRLGLCADHVPAALKGEKPKPQARRTIKLRPRKKVAPQEVIYNAELSVWVEFRELEENNCRWPRGDHPDIRYCGGPISETGRPYCAYHASICYEPKPKGVNTYLIPSSSAFEFPAAFEDRIPKKASSLAGLRKFNAKRFKGVAET